MTKTCERCHEAFQARPWNAGRFCSRACMWSRLPAERFDSFVSKVDAPDGCWLWVGNTNERTGYGSFRFNGRTQMAHRFAYERANRVIPPGLCVCHRCDVRTCVRPDHLFLGTHADNVADKVKKGRQPRGESNAASRLTEPIVIAIRASTELQRVVAARYGITRSTVSMIRARKMWGHVA